MAALAPVRDDALMVATELVSNAVLHAGCDPAEEIELLAELEPRTVRIAVVEPGRPGRSPEVSRAPFTDVGAMGLRLVQMLTTRWGVDRNHQVRVWAELAV